MKDYYKILGIDKKSTKDEIKKAYRTLSKKYHPDINPDGDEMFKEIAEAYEVLSDDKKRSQYDNPIPFMGSNPFEDFIKNFNNRGQRVNKVPYKVIKVNITPIESYLGVKKSITYQTNISCEQCSGSGGKKEVCKTCDGRGNTVKKVGTGFFTQIINTPCERCNGKGEILIDACFNCGGSGKKQNITQLSIDIPKNVSNGDSLKINGKGDFDSRYGYSDLVIHLVMVDTDGFEKINNDLVYTKKINLSELILNKDVELPHPDGKLTLKIPYNVELIKPLRLKNKGYSANNIKGDFYVKLNIVNNELNDNDRVELLEWLNK